MILSLIFLMSDSFFSFSFGWSFLAFHLCRLAALLVLGGTFFSQQNIALAQTEGGNFLPKERCSGKIHKYFFFKFLQNQMPVQDFTVFIHEYRDCSFMSTGTEIQIICPILLSPSLIQIAANSETCQIVYLVWRGYFPILFIKITTSRCNNHCVWSSAALMTLFWLPVIIVANILFSFSNFRIFP